MTSIPLDGQDDPDRPGKWINNVEAGLRPVDDITFRPKIRQHQEAKGKGLGLAISKMIIDRHDGQLTASSAGSENGALF